MTGTRTLFRSSIRHIGICISIAAALCVNVRPASAVVKIFDGFGDADRNNDGAITFYDTDLNDSGTWNDATLDAGLISRSITEVTAAQDASDVGIIWSGIRSYDTMANIPKSRVRIINDGVATGTETTADIFQHGLALGVESRGGGSSFIGRFGQAVAVGPNAGDRLVVSVDFRTWLESANPNSAIGGNSQFNELRWGVYQDTDNEFGQTANYGTGWFINGQGQNGAPVVWGRDDGKWFDAQPGAEGDKGIYADLTFGSLSSPLDGNDRIKWEYNVAGINGTTNNGRIMEGSGVNDTPGMGGDTGTIASPPGNGPGGTIPTTSENVAPHNLSIQFTRQADGSLEVVDLVDTTVILHDTIKTTDTGYNIIGPPADSFNYVAFRNATGDFDYVIDNFKVEAFKPGDYNGDDKVDAADYVLWRGNPTRFGGDPGGYDLWRANFGNVAGTGSSLGSAVPEPSSVLLLLMAGLLATGISGRGFRGLRK